MMMMQGSEAINTFRSGQLVAPFHAYCARGQPPAHHRQSLIPFLILTTGVYKILRVCRARGKAAMAEPAAQAGAPQYRRFFAYMVRRCRCVVGMFSCIRPRGLRMRSYACRSTHDARPNVSAAGGIACKKRRQAGGGRSCAGEAHGGGRARNDAARMVPAPLAHAGAGGTARAALAAAAQPSPRALAAAKQTGARQNNNNNDNSRASRRRRRRWAARRWPAAARGPPARACRPCRG